MSYCGYKTTMVGGCRYNYSFTFYSMAEVSGRTLAVLLGISFCAGCFAGYKIKSWRVRYLRDKRDILARKLVKTQNQIDAATAI